MKINKLRFKDNKQHWELAEITFDYFTLLVGASGVGKTRILKAISVIREMVKGNPSSGVEWFIDLTTNNGDSYRWEGATDDSGISYPLPEDDFLFGSRDTNKTNVQREKIYLNDDLILERILSDTTYLGQKTVKLALNESVLSILKEEELIAPIVTEFLELKIQDLSSNRNFHTKIRYSFLLSKDVEDLTSMDNIQNSSLGVLAKLYLTSLYSTNILERIKENYCDIFPLVEDIRMEVREPKLSEKGVSQLLIASFSIKDKGVEDWISEYDLSSGMYRTLIHLAEIYLCTDGTIFLIDEFENSLGVNCINELTSLMLNSRRKLQFIVTSHHPYIINNIDFKYWKLVTRNGSFVKASDVNNFISGQSSHDKFMQLLQLPQYQTGEA